MTPEKEFRFFEKFSPDYLLAIGIALLTGLLIFRNGWIETDSYAFYNYYCLAGKTFEIPFLADAFFSRLPCVMEYWYAIQSAIWLLGLGVLIHTFKKFHGIPAWKTTIIGLSISFIYSVLAIEDDYLAFPLIAYAAWAIHSKEWKEKILGAAALGVACLLWKGTFLIGGILIASAVNPWLGILAVVGFELNNGIDTWGGSAEAIPGQGIMVLIPFLLLLFFASKEKIKTFRAGKTILLTIPFLILTIFTAKWGLYTIFFLPLWFDQLIEDEAFKRQIAWVAGIVFVISMVGLSVVKEPHAEHWSVVQHAVDLQKQGFDVKNEWWAGRWVEYLGGVSTQAGSYTGPQDANGSYWLGFERKDCVTIESANLLTLQKC